MIIPASEWGRILNGTPPRPGTVTEMTVHYTGAPRVSDTPEQIPGRIKRTEQHQMAKDPNLAAIGYNFLVDKYGRVWEGRGYTFRNAANGGASVHFTGVSSNPWTMSVCCLNGVEDNEPTTAMLSALQWLYRDMCRHFGRALEVRGHQFHRPTSCPGRSLMEIVNNQTIQKGSTVTRIAGTDRFDTAAKIALHGWPSGSEVVYVATGRDYPDSITLGPSARGPILLTERDTLPGPTQTALRALKPKQIIVIGGTNAVSKAVEDSLRQFTV